MNKDEALRLALEALKSKDGWGSSVRDAKEKAIAACEAALEAKNEPVGYFSVNDYGNWEENESNYGIPLYKKDNL